MFTTSKNANPNYLAKIVRLKGLKPHANADRLQTVVIDYQTVITGLNAQEGDIYVYFPVESKINKDFLSFTNSFRDSNLNNDKDQVGFFEENCRVRAMKLRGEKSEGYIVPINEIYRFLNNGTFYDLSTYIDTVDTYFDTVNDILLVEKYIPKGSKKQNTIKQGKQPKENRLIENQFRFHVDTEQLRKNIHKIKLSDNISISYKLHGTSVILSNVLVKRKLNWLEKICSKFLNIEKEEYDVIWASRKVIKNSSLINKEYNHYYNSDIWGIVAEEHGYKIPKGFTIYGEIVGFLPDGGAIQKMGKAFDYGCKENEHELYVYRVTFTNKDGIVAELSSQQVEQFCEKYDFKHPHVYYTGSYFDFILNTLRIPLSENGFKDEDIIRKMESLYNEKDCWMCKNKLPEEGIVLRVDKLDSFEAYKLKSFRFLEGESKQEEVDIETEN